MRDGQEWGQVVGQKRNRNGKSIAAVVIEVRGHRYVLLRNTGEDTPEGPKQPHPANPPSSLLDTKDFKHTLFPIGHEIQN